MLALACALSCATGCSPDSESMSSGSYVQDVTTSSVIVAAVSEGSTRLRLDWGPANSETSEPSAHSLEEETAVQVHGIRAEGLEPNTRYRYALKTLTGQVVGEGTFKTAPADPTASCKFLVLGDSGGTDTDNGEAINQGREVIDDARGASGDDNRQADVVAMMLGRQPDLVLHLGDVVYPDGSRLDYPEGYFRPFAPLIKDTPVYPTLGNHDIKTEGGAPYLETFFTPSGGPDGEGRIYSFDWGGVHFVCLDVVSSPFEAGSPQLTWLAQDLERSQARWKVAYFHVPPFSVEGGGNEDVRTKILPALEAGGVDLVLSGHDHAYGRFQPRAGTLYVVSGGGGKNLRKVSQTNELLPLDYVESVFHFLEVEVDHDRLQLRAIDATGNVFDEVHLVK